MVEKTILKPGISWCKRGGRASFGGPHAMSGPLSAIWGLKGKRDLYLALATLFQMTKEYRRPITGLGEMIALQCVQESLSEAYGFSSTGKWCCDTRFPDEHRNCDIVSIGGPRHNIFTREMRRKFPNLPLRFSATVNGWVLVHMECSEGPQAYIAALESTEAKTDYGLISRLPNPSSKSAVVFLVEGLHTYGLAAAGHTLTRPYALDLVERLREHKSPYWQAFVKAHVESLDAFPPPATAGGGALVDFVPLSEKHLKSKDR